jgi:hypothetical protein
VGAACPSFPLTLLLAWACAAPAARLAAAAIASPRSPSRSAGTPLEQHFTDVLFIEHAGGNLVLAWVFGRTLLAGREPLCTSFSRLVHGTITPQAERYSHGVTVAWTVFFAAMFTPRACSTWAGSAPPGRCSPTSSRPRWWSRCSSSNTRCGCACCPTQRDRSPRRDCGRSRATSRAHVESPR